MKKQEYMLKLQLVLSLEGAFETIRTLDSLGKLTPSQRDAIDFIDALRSILSDLYASVMIEHDRQWGTRLCRAKALDEQEV